MASIVRGSASNHYGLFKVLIVNGLTTTIAPNRTDEEVSELVEKFERQVNCGPARTTGNEKKN